MRILVYAINYAPELIGAAKYTTEMCEWFAARGHDVTVVAPPPYYPRWRVYPPFRAWRYETSTEAGVRVRRAPIWVPAEPGGIARVLHTLSFAVSSFPVLLAEALRRPDVIFATEPSFMNLPGALLASRLAGVPAWLHIQDFEIDLAYGLGQLRRGRKAAASVEAWMSRRFNVVSTISRRMLKRARSKGVAAERAFFLPNWFDPAEIYPKHEPSELRRQLAIPPDKTVALYSGTLGAKQGIESILEAARILADRPIQFVICGDGVAERSLKAAAGANVRFLALQPASALNELLNLADVHLLPQRPGTVGCLFPSKLIGMLASGKPVIAISRPDSEIAGLVAGCGVSVDHGDAAAFAAAIWRLAVDSSERAAFGREARRRALDHFCKDAALTRLESAFATEARVDVPVPLVASNKGWPD